MRRLLLLMVMACGGEPREAQLPPGVVFTYPVDAQRDVPIGARLVVSFTDPTTVDCCAVVGPNGPVEITAAAEGNTVTITSTAFEPATEYALQIAGEPLLRFTTRSDRPRSGPPALIAINGSDPAAPGTFRPILDTSTLTLLFSEPLDPRTVALEVGSIELVDATGATVPATLLGSGIHVALDPMQRMPAGDYEVRLGDRLRDLGGATLAATSVHFTVLDTGTSTNQRFRADAGELVIAHPLIGQTRSRMNSTVLEGNLGDPRALGGPIAFSIPRGQRLSSAALDIALAGAVPSGLSTGDIIVELVTDGGGRLYRNRYRPADTLPDNERSPVLVDLSLDLAIYAKDPDGNAVLAQTVLGVQLSGRATADNGVLTIETLGTLDIDLLGVSAAPTHATLGLVSAPDAEPVLDTIAPAMMTSLPAAESRELGTDDGIELIFDEPIDIDRARAGGIVLFDAANRPVAATLELHGSVVVARPREALAANQRYRVELRDVADRAGNAMPASSIALVTRAVEQTPVSVIAVDPGAPCSLTAEGRCSGGGATDDHYQPFTLAANERITVAFDQPLRASTAALGTACNTGSVRVERVDANGACLAPVDGTLVVRERDIAFVPDRPWTVAERYRLRLFSGLNAICEAGDLCGANGAPANFDALAGTTGGGPDLVVDFVGATITNATPLLASTTHREANRAALRIARTTGLISAATFEGPDCVSSTPEVEACMYIAGAIPARLGERRDQCTLPDGTVAAPCVPVTMSAQAMYSSPVTMRATAMGIPLTTSTGTSVMRVREHADGSPLEGYVIDRGGTPTMVVALDLYMDAPEMQLPIAQHDMHSKRLAVSLEGPLTFGADGRVAISLANVADVPITVGVSAPLGLTGTIDLIVPKGEMRLELLSRAQRGALP